MILKFHKQRLKRDCTWPQEQKLAVKIQQNSLYNYANSIFILPVTSHTPQNFVEFYNELWNVRDRRLDDWFMMSSIWPTVTLCVFYWYCSIVLGKVFHLGVLTTVWVSGTRDNLEFLGQQVLVTIFLYFNMKKNLPNMVSI